MLGADRTAQLIRPGAITYPNLRAFDAAAGQNDGANRARQVEKLHAKTERLIIERDFSERSGR